MSDLPVPGHVKGMDTSSRDHATTSTAKTKSLSPPKEPGADVSFPCGICHKAFSRRDLRDRHRRRCIIASGQERPSRRKSCDNCVQKKLRCSMARPACDRCVQSGAQCHYPASARLPTTPTQNASESLSSRPSSSPFSGSSGAPVPPPTSMTTSYGPVADLSYGVLDSSGVDVMGPPFSAEAAFGASGDGMLPWNEDMTGLLDPSILTPNGIPSSMAVVSPDMSSVWQSMDSLHPQFIEPSGFQPGTTITSLPSTSPSYSAGSSNLLSNDSHSMISTIRGRMNGPSHLVLGHSFWPNLDGRSPGRIHQLCQELLGLLREYLSLIIDREYWSPFIHHRLYRYSMGGMVEPMGIALACVSSQAGSAGESHGFVDRMISEEREKLVRKFHSYIDIPESCLAALHAVCIYQILGLLGHGFMSATVEPHATVAAQDQRREEGEKVAKLHCFFLLKMTRRLCSIHAQALQTPHEDESDWERWKFMESLRRNMFFVNMINILGARTRKLNEDYFEPLGDRMVLAVPLPAPELMWRACSEEEWLVARGQTLGSQYLNPSQRVVVGPRTLGELLQLADVGQADVGALLPITRMILASAYISPPGVDSGL